MINAEGKNISQIRSSSIVWFHKDIMPFHLEEKIDEAMKLALQEFYVMDLMAVRFSLAFSLMLIFALIMRADLKIKYV